jgi:YHS domain-containing protein
MSRIHTTSALTIALMIGLGTAAYAANGQFGNMCSWGLANHKDVQTDCSVNATIKGKTYCFSSADAKSQFMKNPSNNLTKAESFYKSEPRARPSESAPAREVDCREIRNDLDWAPCEPQSRSRVA